MATFRQIMEQVVGMPSTPIAVDNTANQVADLFATAVRSTANIVSMAENAPGGPNETARAYAAVNREQEQSLRIATQQAEQKTREMETYGLPAMVGNLDAPALEEVLKNNPGLSPHAASYIADGVARKRAAEDIIALQTAVANDPARNVSDHLKDVMGKRLPSFYDPRAAGQYQIAMNEQAQALMGKAVLEQAQKANAEAIDGFTTDFANKVAFHAQMGTLPQAFEHHMDEFVSKVAPLSPNMTTSDLRSKAMQTVFNVVAGQLGENIGLDPIKSYEQVSKLSDKMSRRFPQLEGLRVALEGQAAKHKIVIAEQTTQQFEDVLKAANDRTTLDETLANVIVAKKNGVINPIQALKLQDIGKDALDKLRLGDDVMRALGLKVDDKGNYSGDWLSANDNVQVNLGPEHDKQIDAVAVRLGLQGEQRTAWMITNFGRLTDDAIKTIQQMGESFDANTFAAGVNQFNLVWMNNPTYASSLVDGKKLPAKLEVASIMATLGGQDIRSAVSRVSNVSEADLLIARSMLMPKTKAERDALGITDLGSYFDISKKLLPGTFRFGFGEAAGGAPNADVQRLYGAVFSLTAAQYLKDKGNSDPMVVYKAADQAATDFLKAEVSGLDIGGQKYLVFNNKKRAWGLQDAMFDQIGELWTEYRNNAQKQTGVDANHMRLDLDNMKIDPKDKTRYLVPIKYWDIWNGAEHDGGSFSFPRRRPDLKLEVEALRIKNTPMLPDGVEVSGVWIPGGPK